MDSRRPAVGSCETAPSACWQSRCSAFRVRLEATWPGGNLAKKTKIGIYHGTVRVNEEGTSYGFGTFLNRRGADEGDILIAEFELGGSAADCAWATTNCLMR
jgi:hypothetical protein